MSDTNMPMAAHNEGDQCESCAKAAHAAAQSEESSLAFLLALVPVLSLTFFGQLGLL